MGMFEEIRKQISSSVDEAKRAYEFNPNSYTFGAYRAASSALENFDLKIGWQTRFIEQRMSY